MLRIYKPDDRVFTSFGLGELSDAKEVCVSSNIDGTRTLSFTLDFTSSQWSLIKHRRIITCEGQCYRVASYNRKNRGEEPCKVLCNHVFADTGRVQVVYLEEGEMSVIDWLTLAFDGSDFNILTDAQLSALGYEPIRDHVYMEEQGDTCGGQIISRIIDFLGYGELYINNWDIGIVYRVGRNKGVRITEGLNAESVDEDSSCEELINVITVTGQDGLPLSESYVDSVIRSEESIRIYGECRGRLTFDEVDDPAVLLTKALYSISPSNEERVDMPKSSVTVNYIDLSKIGRGVKLDIGDTVNIDSLLTTATYTNTRITSLEFYPYEMANTSITVGSPPRTVTSMIQDTIIAGSVITKTLNGYDEIKSSHLASIQLSLKNYINAQLGRLQLEVHKTGDVWVHPDNPNLALAIVGGMLAIANSKDADGNWNFTSFGDGNGFTASLLTTGLLNASLIQIISDSGLLKISDNKIQMFRDMGKGAEQPLLGVDMGMDADGFKFNIYDLDGNPAIYMGSDGRLRINGVIESQANVTDSLYADYGDIASLTVDQLDTSNLVTAYLLRDTSDQNYITMSGQWQMFICAKTDGRSQMQVVNRYGEPVYWEKDVSRATIMNGSPYINGVRVLTTTKDTGFGVYIYVYQLLIKRKTGFSEDGTVVDVLGVGTDTDDSTLNGQAIITKDSKSLRIEKYHDATGVVSSGMYMNDTSSYFRGFDVQPSVIEINEANSSFRVLRPDGKYVGVKINLDTQGRIRSLVSDLGKSTQFIYK